MDSKEPVFESLTSVKSTPTAKRSSKNTGRKSRAQQTSKKQQKGQLFLFAGCGQEDSLAKMSLWRAWGRELGLKGSNLDSFTSFLDWLNGIAPEFFLSKTCPAFSLPTKEEISASSFGLWPNSGIAWDGVCLTAKISASPNLANESSLWELIEKGTVPPKYFLSPNAAKGMLRRADRMGRNLFPPLRKALEILSKAPS